MMTNQNLSDRNNSGNKGNEIPDDSIENIKLKTVDLVLTTEEQPITLTNPSDSGIATNDIAAYRIVVNEKTMEVSFRALKADQLSSTDVNAGFEQNIEYKNGQLFWGRMQQWEDYFLSDRYDYFYINFRAKKC